MKKECCCRCKLSAAFAGGLVEAYDENITFGRSVLGGELFGLVLVVVGDAYANPVIAYGTGELQDFRGLVATQQSFFQLCCYFLVFDAADLNTPATAGGDGGRRF